MYTDNEVRMADAALQCLKNGTQHRRTVLHAMGGLKDECYVMLRALTDDLKLVSKGYDDFTLTFEGRKAVEMGFKAYVEVLARKGQAPEPSTVFGLSREGWYKIATLLIGLLAAVAALLAL